MTRRWRDGERYKTSSFHSHSCVERGVGVFDEESAVTFRGWNPSVDRYETDDAIVVEAGLPGVRSKKRRRYQ
jgi:HSP20 family molecular chaperone IbpA